MARFFHFVFRWLFFGAMTVLLAVLALFTARGIVGAPVAKMFSGMLVIGVPVLSVAICSACSSA